MNKLTDRLQLIADMVSNGETMADIGTDHGFLPLYLKKNGISPRVIMCDISGPSLDKAREAFAAEEMVEGASFREGDGLDVLSPGEADVIVIAGMGGVLITEILGSDMDKSASFGKYILQPRNNAGYLRHWLCAHGFNIEKNALVREGKFICEIILANAAKSRERADMDLSERIPDESDPRWDMPDDLRESYPELAAEYAAIKIRREERKLQGLRKSRSDEDEQIGESIRRIEHYRRFRDVVI